MQESLPISLEDRLVADVFQKSYREYLELKPTHIRWNKLAPDSIRYLGEAHAQLWSAEKIADYLNCSPKEAMACLRRYIVSKRVNSQNSTPERIREAFFEWLGGVVEMDEKAKRGLASELSSLVANQLHAAALAKEDLFQISGGLEGHVSSAPIDKPSVSLAPEPPKWGPQWKA